MILAPYVYEMLGQSLFEGLYWMNKIMSRKKMCYDNKWYYSWGGLPRVTILVEWIRHFNDLAVGEAAAPACFSRENAEGAAMPPLRSH
jgi:hypothetical protein